MNSNKEHLNIPKPPLWDDKRSLPT